MFDSYLDGLHRLFASFTDDPGLIFTKEVASLHANRV